MSKKQITVIPATIGLHQKSAFGDPTAKRRVAAYARVSTDSEEQQTSYEAQVDYYTKYIKERDDWEFINVYTDEGISAVNTKRREGFKQMVADALAGKIDLIVTKSVSRFARNTVDSLNTIRQLKEKHVECYFEKESIWTFDGKGELLLTIMSSLAQEESRSISENVTWGQRKRFSDGKVTMPYGRFLGYTKGADGKPKIVEEEARIVREIFQMFLNNISIREICRELTQRGVPTPGGKQNWAVSTVRSILSNERYKGDALLQKRFTVDFLSKKMKRNEGEVPQYYVENSHPAIISPEMFDLVQAELEKVISAGYKRSSVSCFSGKIFCAYCGEVYSRKTWTTTKKRQPVKRQVWQCNAKYPERGEVCPSIHVTEEEIKEAFLLALNQIISDRKRYIANLEPILELLADTGELDTEECVLKERADGIHAQMEALVNESARKAQNQNELRERYAELNSRYESVKGRLAEVADEKQAKRVRRENILRFMDTVRERESLLTAFDEPLWRASVERMTVRTKKDIVVRFRDGQEVNVDITER